MVPEERFVIHDPPASVHPESIMNRVLLLALALAVAITGRADDAAPATTDRHPELKRLGKTEDVWLDVAGKRVVVGGVICLDKGPIEYFACPEKTKDYESLVAVRSSSQLIHAGLLAIGLQPGTPVSFDPEYQPAKGPVVSVTMRWKDKAGKTHEVPAQEWIRDTRTKAAMKERWVFAGSAFWTDPADGKEYYQADGGDFICLSNFPTAMLDLPIPSTQTNDALLFEVFEGRVPPAETEVEIVLAAQKGG
jgi:hypothetical protein